MHYLYIQDIGTHDMFKLISFHNYIISILILILYLVINLMLLSIFNSIVGQSIPSLIIINLLKYIYDEVKLFISACLSFYNRCITLVGLPFLLSIDMEKGLFEKIEQIFEKNENKYIQYY